MNGLWININVYWSNDQSSWTGSLQQQSSSCVQPLGADATTLIQPWLIQPWNPYTANDNHDKDRKQLIEMICEIKGKKYKQEKRIKVIKVSTKNIKINVKNNLDIDLEVDVESK
jgi:hypothetical protein